MNYTIDFNSEVSNLVSVFYIALQCSFDKGTPNPKSKAKNLVSLIKVLPILKICKDLFSVTFLESVQYILLEM